jgi:hypothetical protein
LLIIWWLLVVAVVHLELALEVEVLVVLELHLAIQLQLQHHIQLRLELVDPEQVQMFHLIMEQLDQIQYLVTHLLLSLPMVVVLVD